MNTSQVSNSSKTGLVAAAASNPALGRAREIGLDLGLLVARVWAGGFMLFGHGIPKVNMFGKDPSSFPGDPIGLGPTLSYYGVVGAEVVGAAMIALGLLTRLAALPYVFAMAVASFVVHASDPLFMTGQGAAKEPALMYGAAGLAILLTGPGRFSIDHLLMRRFVRR